jgi:hypothetical protein
MDAGLFLANTRQNRPAYREGGSHMTTHQIDESTAAITELIEYLVTICGEPHRCVVQDVIERAYQCGRTSIAYEAALRFKTRLGQHEERLLQLERPA